MNISEWEAVATTPGNSANRNGTFATERTFWASVHALPTLPASLFRFLGLVGDPERSMDDLADFVCQDPALLARVLPLIPGGFTSADPAGPSLRESIKSFGRDRIRALANITPLIHSVEPIASGSFATMLWERSVSCATAAQAAATLLRLAQPERYYVAGLLHDIGYLVVLQKSPTLFSAAVRRWTQRSAGLAELETEIFGASHGEIGASVARQLNIDPWYLPAIQNHHTPGMDEHQVSTITAAAAAFCSWQGMDIFPKQMLSPSTFSGGFRGREARTREMHELLRGLFPQVHEIERHRMLDFMSLMVRPARAKFQETFLDWDETSERWMRPYRHARRDETVAAVA